MAVTNVDLVWSGETWDDTIEGQRAYRELYRVISNDPQESAQNVRGAAGIPALGAAFVSDAAAIAISRSASRLDTTRLVWEVTVEYEIPELEPTDPDNPLNDPVRIRWTSSLERVPAFKDINDEAIVNSAGDYFDPPPEKDQAVWTINIQFNAAVVPAAIISYAGAVNSGAITIDGIAIATEQARMVGLDISEVQERNEISFRTVTLGVAVVDDGDPSLDWDLSILDQGFRIKEEMELKDILIPDEDGNSQRPSSPVLLDGMGAKLTDPSPNSAVFLDFSVTQKLDFTVFPGIS